jgi:ketosteroid isomerase-like protein
MSQENVDRLRHLYEVFKGVQPGDHDALDSFLEEFYDPDIVVHELPHFPGPSEYSGWAGVRDWFEHGSEVFETFEFEPQEFVEAGSEVVVTAIARGRSRAGADLEMPLVHVVTFKGTKVAEFKSFFTKAQALEAVGLSEQDAHADS